MNELNKYSIRNFIEYYIHLSSDTMQSFFKKQICKNGDENITEKNLRKIIQLRYGIDI